MNIERVKIKAPLFPRTNVSPSNDSSQSHLHTPRSSAIFINSSRHDSSSEVLRSRSSLAESALPPGIEIYWNFIYKRTALTSHWQSTRFLLKPQLSWRCVVECDVEVDIRLWGCGIRFAAEVKIVHQLTINDCHLTVVAVHMPHIRLPAKVRSVLILKKYFFFWI